MQGTRSVVTVSTNIGKSCKECNEWLNNENFAANVNHYLREHDYTLLHVGSERPNGHDGALWHHTVAVLGKPQGTM